MLLPIVRRWSPGSPSWENPRSAKSRTPFGRVHGGELVDEPLRQRVARAGPADDDRRPVANEADGVANLEDLGHGR
jgi:hypothetical protein